MAERRYYLVSQDDLTTHGDGRGSTKRDMEELLSGYKPEDFEDGGYSGLMVIYGEVVPVSMQLVVEWPDEKE